MCQMSAVFLLLTDFPLHFQSTSLLHPLQYNGFHLPQMQIQTLNISLTLNRKTDFYLHVTIPYDKCRILLFSWLKPFALHISAAHSSLQSHRLWYYSYKIFFPRHITHSILNPRKAA